MLKLFRKHSPDCESVNRRNFLLEVGSIGSLGLSLDMLLRGQAASASPTGAQAGDVNCILIWTQGGTSHHDTLDPKPQARAEVRGEFGVIDTVVPGIQFSDQMPQFAKQLGRFAVMRNLNPRNGSHGRADAIMMSGKPVNPTVTFPCYGSVIAKEKGYQKNMPPFVQTGTHLDRRWGGSTAGHLGIENNPFELPGDPNDENFTVRDVTPPGGISLARLDRRRAALKTIDQLQRNLERPSPALEALDEFYQNAFSIIADPATQKAFDLKSEKPKVRDAYGRTELGQGCLLARRLIEAGTRFVTVTSGHWDTHGDNFNRLKKLLPPLDTALPRLLIDLEQRGLLDNTLVVWMTDFGRTPVVNRVAGRDHWKYAGILCMAGAGTPGGLVFGKTDDEGAQIVGNQYDPNDVGATIYTKLGIPLNSIHVTPDGRPIQLCDGRVIEELMS